MKFFIDTANLNDIQEAFDLGVLDGVTTNPSLMAKEGISGEDNVRAHYKAICDIVENNVSAEVISTEFDEMIKEGKELAKIDDKIVVKVPMIKDGVKAIKYLTSEGIRTNCTLVFSPGQALLALVVRTMTGGAQAVALGIDWEEWPEVLGTIAGDDTILLILRDADHLEAIRTRLAEIAQRP